MSLGSRIHGIAHVAHVGVMLGTHPHTAWFALRHAAHPGDLLEAAHAFDDAKAMERKHFGPRDHTDDGIDALRHTYAAAMLSYRLVRNRGDSVKHAVDFTVDAGRAYEQDGNDKGETRASARMDEHNNAVGARLGAELARARATHHPAALLDAVRAVLGSGALDVIRHGKPDPSRPTDLP